MGFIKMSSFRRKADVYGNEDIIGIDGGNIKISIDDLKKYLGITSATSFKGAATPSTNPGPQTDPVFYFATSSGTYTNFGGLTVNASDGINILSFDGSSWTKTVVPINLAGYATNEAVSSIELLLNEEIGKNNYVRTKKNLVAKSDIILGYYQSNGNLITSSDNWISTKRISVNPSTQYTAHRLGVGHAYPAVIIWNDSGSVIQTLPSDALIKTFTTPSDAAEIAFAIQNRLGIGLNPLDPGGYGNTFQLEEGATATEYEEPGLILAEKVSGVSTAVEERINSKTLPLEVELIGNRVKLDLLLMDYNTFMRFDGTSSGFIEPISLQNEGDYLELEMRLSPVFQAYQDGLGIAGSGPVSANVFGFYTSSSIYFRDSAGGSYLQFTNIPDAFGFHKYRLEARATNWDLYIDDILHQSVVRAGDFVIDNLGEGYNSTSKAKFDLKYAELKAGSTTKKVELVSDFITTSNIQVIAERKGGEEEEDTGYAPIYVSYDPTGYEGFALVTVFVRRKNKNTYTGYQIRNHYNMADETYIDYWRIQRADEYSFNGVAMSRISNFSLYHGESEWTMICEGKGDHTGGTHGDELTASLTWFMDGIPMVMDSAFILEPCKEFSYMVKSTLHETANTGGEPIAGHPQIALHNKRTSFFEGGYKTYNRIEFTAQTNVIRAYVGIVCLGKNQAQQGYNENFDIKTFVGDGGASLVRGYGMKQFWGFNDTTEYYSYITSRLIKPVIPEENIEMWITDRPNDSKYYRATPTRVFEIGEVLEMECKIEMR